MAQERETESKETSFKEKEIGKEVAKLLAPFQAFVTYSPLRTEVDWRTMVTLPKGVVYTILPRASLDPLKEALSAMEHIGEAPCAILIPGKRFDAHGTRHGQGGGWYDRFLSRVPKEWLRVGFCSEQQFSKDSLIRKSWDQPMDAVVVMGEKSGTLYQCTE